MIGSRAETSKLEPSAEPLKDPSTEPSAGPSTEPLTVPWLRLVPLMDPSTGPSTGPLMDPSVGPSVVPSVGPSLKLSPLTDPLKDPSTDPSTDPSHWLVPWRRSGRGARVGVGRGGGPAAPRVPRVPRGGPSRGRGAARRRTRRPPLDETPAAGPPKKGAKSARGKNANGAAKALRLTPWNRGNPSGKACTNLQFFRWHTPRRKSRHSCVLFYP